MIFSYLGYMAGQLGVDVKDVAADGELTAEHLVKCIYSCIFNIIRLGTKRKNLLNGKYSFHR